MDEPKLNYAIYEALNIEAINLRISFGIGEYSAIDFESLLFSKEEMTYLSFPMPDNINAICVKDSSNKVIAINSKDTLGKQRYSLAHELYHLYVQKDFLFSVCTDDNKKPIEEVKADAFATYFMLPKSALYWFIKQTLNMDISKGKIHFNFDQIIKIEQYYKISHAAMLNRLKIEKMITQQEYIQYQDGVIKRALNLGYDDSLYIPPANEYKAKGKYIHYAKKLLELGLINDREFEDYMVDVGREDLICPESKNIVN